MVMEEDGTPWAGPWWTPARSAAAPFRALFTLRTWAPRGRGLDRQSLRDGSALLKHELAYCPGDTSQEPMVRHEAGEALGAIGNPDVLDILKHYSEDPVVEVAETCQLAVRRLEWLQENKQDLGSSPYLSVDPAPLQRRRMSPSSVRPCWRVPAAVRPLQSHVLPWRNVGGRAAVAALERGSKTALWLLPLFRHEIGYVLGQMQGQACVPQLTAALCSLTEIPMVRHECAEALGSIAHPSCLQDPAQPSPVTPERVVLCFVELCWEAGADFGHLLWRL
uniref:Uncharacterized protein n=1 Tax=Melopsittacus undulatus TaxID=13146 RepID=A0A8V5GMH3_MELUD